MLQNILVSIWILSAIYCLYKLYKRSRMSSHDGVIGYSPGLEMIMVIMIGPVLAIKKDPKFSGLFYCNVFLL